jgi:hypothetical protein
VRSTTVRNTEQHRVVGSRTMSSTSIAQVGPSGAPDRPGALRQPRVRHLAREAVVLMLFSAGTSSALAGCLLLLTSLGHQG